MRSNSELDPCGEDMIPLSFHTVKPDGQAQIVPNQSVKASYATVWDFNSLYTEKMINVYIILPAKCYKLLESTSCTRIGIL